MLYQHLVHLREDTVAGVGPWVWARTDVHAWIGPKMDWEHLHYPKILNMIPEENRNTVVQAGGNMGMYPRLLSDIFKKVYTFEPDPVNFHCLVANCQKSNIVKMNAALGYKHEMVRVSVEPFHDWETNYGVRVVVPNGETIVPTIRIDDLALDHCDLIMIDTEGYELNILKGAVNTLENFKPVVFAEFADPCIPYMQSFGYSVVDRAAGDLIFAAK
jgi:FkbM family methyltransferase